MTIRRRAEGAVRRPRFRSPSSYTALLAVVLAVATASLGASAATAAVSGAASTAEPTDTSATAELMGTVGYADGSAAAGIAVDLFTAQASGGRDQFLSSTITGGDGRYRFAVEDGCYVVVLIAPDGQRFVPTGRFVQAPVCLSGGIADSGVDGQLASAVATIGGRVDQLSGGPVDQVIVDLFHAEPDGARTGYITSATTAADGSYTLAVPEVGCYQLVFVAPTGSTFTGGTLFDQVDACAAEGEQLTDRNAQLAPAVRAQLGGRVAYESDTGAQQVIVDLFLAGGDGTRAAYIQSTSTDIGGRFSFDLAPACYLVVMVAPPGETFIGGTAFAQDGACIDGGEIVASLEGNLVGSAEAPTELSPAELEIVRLTNELRTDPAGALARIKPMPDCVSQPFYSISIDPATGHPAPVIPLELSEIVSVEMARAWAIDMQQGNEFGHRPSHSQQAIYDRLGLAVSAWGENIAWFAGYPPDDTARIHFEGWRESDTGHYCSLITGRFSHFGVGEYRVDSQSWAVQNFYAPR